MNTSQQPQTHVEPKLEELTPEQLEMVSGALPRGGWDVPPPPTTETTTTPVA